VPKCVVRAHSKQAATRRFVALLLRSFFAAWPRLKTLRLATGDAGRVLASLLQEAVGILLREQALSALDNGKVRRITLSSTNGALLSLLPLFAGRKVTSAEWPPSEIRRSSRGVSIFSG
jgi:hypothetical protein